MPLSLTALASPHGPPRDTDASATATVHRTEEDAPREALSLTTGRIRPVMPPKRRRRGRRRRPAVNSVREAGMRNWLVGFAAFLISIASASSAFAQNAQITGTVKDSSGGDHSRRDRHRAQRRHRPDAHRRDRRRRRVPAAVAAAGPLLRVDRAAAASAPRRGPTSCSSSIRRRSSTSR